MLQTLSNKFFKRAKQSIYNYFFPKDAKTDTLANVPPVHQKKEFGRRRGQ